MYKSFDFTQLGGFPLNQDRLKFMQESYLGIESALAALTGNNAVLSGCIVTGLNVSDGWIVVNGELLPFIGGTQETTFKIEQLNTALHFANGEDKEVQFYRYATPGTGTSQFNYSSLVRTKTIVELTALYDRLAYASVDHNGTMQYYGYDQDYQIKVCYNKELMQLSGHIHFRPTGIDPHPNELFYVTDVPTVVAVRNTHTQVFSSFAVNAALSSTADDAYFGVGTVLYTEIGFFKYDLITKRFYFSPKNRNVEAYYYFSTTFFV